MKAKYKSPALIKHLLKSLNNNMEKITTVHDITEISMFYNHFYIKNMNESVSLLSSTTEEALKNLYIIHYPHMLNEVNDIKIHIVHKHMDTWRGDIIPVYIFCEKEDGNKSFEVKHLCVINKIGIDEMKNLIRKDFIEAYLNCDDIDVFLEQFYTQWEYLNTTNFNAINNFSILKEYYDYIDNGDSGMTIRLDLSYFLKDFVDTVTNDMFKMKLLHSKIIRIDCSTFDVVDAFLAKQGIDKNRYKHSYHFAMLIHAVKEYAFNIETLEIFSSTGECKYFINLTDKMIANLIEVMKRCKSCIIDTHFKFPNTTLMIDISTFKRIENLELYNRVPDNKIGVAMFNQLSSLKHLQVIRNVIPFTIRASNLQHLGLKSDLVPFMDKVYDIIPLSVKILEIDMYMKQPFAFDLCRFKHLEKAYFRIYKKEPHMSGFLKVYTSGVCSSIKHLSLTECIVFEGLCVPNLYEFCIKYTNVVQTIVDRIPRNIVDLRINCNSSEDITLDLYQYPNLQLLQVLGPLHDKIQFIGKVSPVIDGFYLVG